MTDEPLYAGYLCATHVGKIIRVDGVEGMCHEVRHRNDRLAVLVVLYVKSDSLRTDGAVKRDVRMMSLDARAVVEVLAD